MKRNLDTIRELRSTRDMTWTEPSATLMRDLSSSAET